VVGAIKLSRFSDLLTPHTGIPENTRQVDYEVELAIVIGRKCKNIRVDEAYDYVAGYSVFNDVSARDIQYAEMNRGVLLMGKNLDTFT
jgi:2-keto-4-pentenoate hydratase/2-oxohepta-3-ene-1,7-dioic acid hydratase in catechol pathway